MSRCFPYPPPGYSSAKFDAFIEFIKKEKERKKEKRRERKKAKKERKDEINLKLNKSDIPKYCINDTEVEYYFNKKREAETEQSNLTDEPASLSIPSSSSEGTEKSKKRKRNSSDTHVHGKVGLIRLSSKNQNELDALAGEQQQPCSTSERLNRHDGRYVDYARFLNKTCNVTAHNTEGTRSNSGQIEAGKTGTNDKPTFPKKTVLTPMQKLELQYNSLLEDCFHPPIQGGCVYPVDDLDWLLVDGNQETRAKKKSRFGNESLSCSRSSGLWPRAEYLPKWLYMLCLSQ